MSDTNLPIGDIRFLDNAIPALEAGKYKITVTHTVTEASHNIDTRFDAERGFIVAASRFMLPAGSVHTRFPAPLASGSYNNDLPFIVLNDAQKEWPWSRELIQPANAHYQAPWLALMLFKKEEIIATGTTPNTVLSRQYAIDEIIAPTAPNTLGPAIDLSDYEQSKGNLRAWAIDVSATTFLDLAPNLTELPFLAHVRQINTGGQTIDGLEGEGYNTIIMSNRLPEVDTDYIVHLVSLEGWSAYLPISNTEAADRVLPDDSTTVRLISLDSWTFHSGQAELNFAAMVEVIDKDTLKLPVEVPASWQNTDLQQIAEERLNNGYVALNHQTRLGEQSWGWYRGPFSPVTPKLISNTDPDSPNPLVNADEALIYDVTTGVFDHSYAVAWQMGRLATLHNATAAKAIWNWKKEGIALLQTIAKIMNQPQNGTSTDVPSLVEAVRNSQAGHQRFMQYLGTRLGDLVVPAPDEASGHLVRVGDPSGLRAQADRKVGLLSKSDLHEALEKGKDPHAFLHQQKD